MQRGLRSHTGIFTSHRSVRQVVAVGGGAECLALGLAPADDDAPGDGLQRRGRDDQHADGGYVGRPPPLLHAQDAHSFEDVDDPQHDHRVPHRVVVHVPVYPVLVLLLRPQEQRQDLQIDEHHRLLEQIKRG